ncbi:CPBP family intramembrane glutamic endopeptidase [Lapidilactobacillus wuchangensis]|uniref:CPBP family intramembrane glutamic endopeptidase n=1 Tax=Lapidilactobacillus wuchangensis TaxID=2486001 RepID=UPI001CDBE099|nr:CPBP family intramembrane glutamic endopeptidase [Lapidilactobacillus wuchangensis]
MSVKMKPVIGICLTLLVGIIYAIPGSLRFLHLSVSGTGHEIIGAGWNLLFCGLIGYFLLQPQFQQQFSHFKLKVLLWGVPLAIVVGLASDILFQVLFGKSTENTVANVITVQMIVFRVPFMLLGEELICTNIMIALEKMGLKFRYASVISGLLFAAWHIPAYGFVPLQLIITILPIRLALNYIWKKSNSVWVSWICHFAFDAIGFIQYFS